MTEITQVVRILQPGSAVLLQNVAGSSFLLLQKIDPKPRSLFSDKYSLFGGRTKPGEDSYRALDRTLHEEWSDHAFVDEILRTSIMQEPLDLQAREWGGMYKLFLYIASASNTMVMNRWIRALCQEGAVKEGRAVHLTRMELIDELETPERFHAGLDIALDRHLRRLE